MTEQERNAFDPGRSAVVHLDVARGARVQTPQRVLYRALRGAGLFNEWKELTTRSAVVRPLSLNLARYLGVVVPSYTSARPLLVECIHHGLNVDSVAHSYQLWLIAYLRATLQCLPQVLEWRVEMHLGDRNVVWNPLEHCLTDWWARHRERPEAFRRHRPIDSTYVDLSPANYRLIVLTKYLARGALDISSVCGQLDDVVARYG